MTNIVFYVKYCFTLNLQPDLSENPFYAAQRSEKIDFVEPKGLGAEDGLSCPNNDTY